MPMPRPWLLAACAAAALGAATPASGAPERRFAQDRFAIGFWVDPPADAQMDARYKEIAEANFTLVIGGFGATTPETVRRQLRLCQKYGLKAVVARAGLPPDRLPDGPACWGYMLRDEPGAAAFPELRREADAIQTARPGRFAYINLFPNYAPAWALGTATYDEHVERFVREVAPRVLSMDHYPMMQPGADSRESYCANLETMRRCALEAGIPFWNFFNTMPFGPHFDPTEAAIRWQVYTSLAYGAKGVLYFCYWTPAGAEFPRGGAIMTAEGRRTRHYEQAKRINAALKHLGPTLMRLTSLGVRRLAPKQDAAALEGTPIRRLDGGEWGAYLAGLFRHADGRRAVLLTNYDYTHTSWPTVAFDADPARVREVDPRTGREAPVVDDSPAMEGLQVSLDAGEGRLFLLPP